MTASEAAVAAPRTTLLRDPVLVLPAVVAAGLAIGWLGVDDHVSGIRVTLDVALAWALLGAALVVLERPRWRSATWLLGAAGFALLAADLVWAGSDVAWTVGVLVQGLWAAILVHLALAFPTGRPASRVAM